jgi:hypothetical protein
VGRAVVVAVLVLAALAAADGLRRAGSERVVVPQAKDRPRAAAALLPGRTGGFAAASDGRLTRTRVLRGGEEILSRQEIDAAFPAPLEGVLFDVAHVAVAPDGTLVLAVYKFPPGRSVLGAIELWRGERLVGAFPVPAGSFGGGIGFSEDGSLVATFAGGRSQATLFDRGGRWEAYVPLG